MLPPHPVQQAIDRLVAETRKTLREYYQENGMDKPVPMDIQLIPQERPKVYRSVEPAKRIVPPGVKFTPNPRVSGALRDRYLNHLRDLCGQEYIDVAEMGARVDAMMLANTEDELKFLIQDLPALPAGAPVKRSEENSLKELRASAVEFTGYATLATVMGIGIFPAHSMAGLLVQIVLMGTMITLWVSAIFKWSLYHKKKNTEKE